MQLHMPAYDLINHTHGVCKYKATSERQSLLLPVNGSLGIYGELILDSSAHKLFWSQLIANI